MAIGKKVKFLSILIAAADGKTLAAKDGEGNTPLHLAAEYKRCREGQLPIIELIVSKSDAAVRDTENGDFNKAGQSPYLYHEVTRQKAIEREKAKGQKNRETASGRHRADGDQKGATPQTTSAIPPSTTMSGMPNVHVLPSGANQGGPATRILLQDGDRTKFGGSGQSGFGTLSSPVVHNPPPLNSGSRAEPKPPEVKDKKTESSTRSTRVDEATVRNVERFLKLHYLRSRHYNECMEILYGRNTLSGTE